MIKNELSNSDDFAQMTRKEQKKMLFYKGKHIATKTFDFFNMALFILEGIYVEVVYNSKTFENLQITPSDQPINLDLYINEMKSPSIEF